ncbi:PilZ domain-containing protein [Cohnella yongneupensis]|uniref:PilZ domain-containing protein n=1 Tax=Cohnella yongneupensis TaxID=425006 RepID=A0ABW0R2P4_9BACL
MDQEEQENRRQYIRFGLHLPLYAELSLLRVGDRTARSRSQKVLLDNISFGGCLFRTHLELPPRDDVEWMLKMQLNHHEVHLKATIVRVQEEEGYFLYGVSWKLSTYERHLFHYRLNEYLQSAYAFAPHIQTLYRKVMERGGDKQFKRLDYTT